MRSFQIILSVFCLFFSLVINGQTYKNKSASVHDRVEDLLSQMTLEEKIGQMTQAERAAVINNDDIKTYFIGSVISGGGSSPANNSAEGWADMYDQLQQQALSTRLGIPIMYGIDAVHGHNNLYGAVIFPHNIGMGCTRDPLLVKKAAQITAREVAASGLDWTFAPCIAVPQNEHWGRTYEGYGEDPLLVKLLATAAIEGFQGDTLADSTSVIACAKHFLADGGTTGGIDQGDALITEEELREIHLPGYIEAVNSGVATVMASFSSWNGQKMHGNKYLLTDVLKNELGFQGPVVSDWNAIQQLSGAYKEKVKTAINAGIDIAMEPFYYYEFASSLKQLVNEGAVSEDRIDDAVRRILTLKFKAGLFEHPYANRNMFDSVGNAYHRSVARQCVRESIVLLKKKDNLLPLARQNLKIHVAGSNANDIGNQCGGWTIGWQGYSGDITPGTTIYEGLKEVAPDNDFFYTADGTEWMNEHIAIAVIGEKPYAEYSGDRNSIDNLISKNDIEAVIRLKSYNIPVIVVLVTGRPVNISAIYPYADAIIAAWLPGTEGQGVADVLFGDYTPTGKLSHSWPKSDQQVPVNMADESYDPLFPYNFGITSFENSSKGSAPMFYTATINNTGMYVELSFNKAMMNPSEVISSFSIKNNNNELTIQTAGYCPNDSSRIRLYTEGTIMIDDQVYVSYTPGSYMSADSGILEPIENHKVTNNSEMTDSGILENLENDQFTIYPNPFSNGFYIGSSREISHVAVEIIDLSGRVLFREYYSISNTQPYYVKVNNMRTGIYLIRISSENDTVLKKVKIVNSKR